MNAVNRALAMAGLLLLLGTVGGCTVRPMLADQPENIPGQSPRAQLASVSVAPVETRFAQEVRNHLIFLLHGGAGEPANPAYTLELSVASRTSSAARIQSGDEDEPTAGVLTMIANYRLLQRPGRTVIAQGTRNVSASFDRPRQEFALLRAERDAENRAVRELAELIHLAVAQDLARADAG